MYIQYAHFLCRIYVHLTMKAKTGLPKSCFLHRYHFGLCALENVTQHDWENVTQRDWEVFIAVLLAKTRDGQKEREREREREGEGSLEICIDLEGCMLPLDLRIRSYSSTVSCGRLRLQMI